MTKEVNLNSYNVNIEAKLGKKVWIDKFVTIFKDVEVGDYTCINQNTLIESGAIGKFCSIAANVSIGMGEHPLSHLSTHVGTYENTSFGLINNSKKFNQLKKPPVIGHDVWVARGAVILRGVKVGNGAVIAACAVVTKDVPPYAVVAGNPAKIIKYRYSKSIIEKIESIQWWDDEIFYKNKFRDNGMDIEYYIGREGNINE